jgi:outer membrane receptor protein involved in Fe transport
MKNRHLVLLVFSLSVSQAALAQNATVQDTASSDNDTQDIIVTANRREESLSNVGMSISAFNNAALEQRNVASVADLAKLVPGFSVGSAMQGVTVYSLRGVGTNETTFASNSSVAVYQDQIPLTIPASTAGPSFDLQRVEVLKGPQGTLYGQNATGGLINFVANKPTDHFEAGITGSFGRFSTGSAEGYVSGPLSDTIRARIALRTIQSGPWQQSITRPGDELGSQRKFAGRAIVEFTPTSTLRVRLNFNGWVDHSDTLALQTINITGAVPSALPAVTANSPLAEPRARSADWDSHSVYNAPSFRRHDHFYQGSADIAWELMDGVTLTSLTAVGRLHINAPYDLDGLGAAQDVLQIARVQGKTFSQELRLNGDMPRLNWTIGAAYGHDVVHELYNQLLADYSGGQNLFGVHVLGNNTLNNQNIRNWGIFASAEYQLTDTLALTAGIRYNKERRKFAGCLADDGDGTGAAGFGALANFVRSLSGLPPLTADQFPQPGECATYTADNLVGMIHDKLTEDNVPWNVNLNWKPRNDILIYARVSEGYKAGNFPDLAAATYTTYNPVKQEKLRAYELGLRARLSPAVRVEAAGFIYDYTDKQQRGNVILPVFGIAPAQVNIPKVRIKGFEAGADFRPFQGFSLAPSVTYVDSEVRRYEGFNNDGIFLDQSGFPINFTPKWSVNVDANYSHPINDNLTAFIGANLSYRSKTTSGIASSALFQIDSYTLLDGQFGVEGGNGKWKAWIFGKNITNKYYWTNVVHTGDVTVRFPAMPATYGVAASFKY